MTTHSTGLANKISQMVADAIRKYGIVNVPVVAQRIRDQHPDEGLSVNDAEGLVLGFATFYCAAIEFDRTGCAWRKRLPVSAQNDGLLLDIVEDGDWAALAGSQPAGSMIA